jgi:DNA-binding transcriptional ArsR family regulator
MLRPRESASVFAALGDETRFRIVSRLSKAGPASIAGLTSEFEISRQAVTKHLRVLEAAGLVRGTRPGRTSAWELLPRRLVQAKESLDRISADWDSALERLRDFVESD